jgi:hypothetical protein
MNKRNISYICDIVLQIILSLHDFFSKCFMNLRLEYYFTRKVS